MKKKLISAAALLGVNVDNGVALDVLAELILKAAENIVLKIDTLEKTAEAYNEHIKELTKVTE